MCSIFGVVGSSRAALDVLEGLSRVTRRDYDSAGVAAVSGGGLKRCRALGDIGNLAALLQVDGVSGRSAVGHTRWATNGSISIPNTHPHMTDLVAVVHNGRIENHREIRSRLVASGRSLSSDTDTEVIAWLITEMLEEGLEPRDAVMAALGQLHGCYALGILFAGHDDLAIGVCRGNPLAVAVTPGRSYLGSEIGLLAHYSREVICLEDGDFVEVRPGSVTVYDDSGLHVSRRVRLVEAPAPEVTKAGHAHFMHKEIAEQPDLAERLVAAYADGGILSALPFNFTQVSRIKLIGSGSCYHAGLVARSWFEDLAEIPVDVEMSSEFRHSHALVGLDEVAVLISQSGESPDTLDCLRLLKQKGITTVALVNAPESSMAREADVVLRMLSGPEAGVVPTKTFVAELMVLIRMAMRAAEQRGTLDRGELRDLDGVYRMIPSLLGRAVEWEPVCLALAAELVTARRLLFVGRGLGHALSCEAASRFEQMTGRVSQAVAGGELHHGVLSVVDEETVVVALAPTDDVFETVVMDLEDVVARNGRVVLFSDSYGASRLGELASAVVTLPTSHVLAMPLVSAVLFQMIAYHAALQLGVDADKVGGMAKTLVFT